MRILNLEFSFTNLKKIQKYVLGGGSAQVIFTIVLTAVLIWLVMRPSWEESIFWGFLYALSSTAIVIKTLQDSNKIAIIGDMFELGDEASKEHQSIVDLASSLNINRVILIGKLFETTKTESEHIKSFGSFESFKDAFSNLNITKSTLLIKASRGMKLERILDLI